MDIKLLKLPPLRVSLENHIICPWLVAMLSSVSKFQFQGEGMPAETVNRNMNFT